MNNQYRERAASSTFSLNSAANNSGWKRVYQDAKMAAQTLTAKGWKFYFSLSTAKRVVLVMISLLLFIAVIMFIIFREKVFELLLGFAEAWKSLESGPYIMFLLITIVSFPPLIGYSTLGSLCGMMYGFPGGWPILASATLFGSTCSFLTFRYLLSGFAARLAQSNKKFAALTKALEHDNFTLLSMIRLCPLPYSLSNGGLASISTVSVKSFFLATVVTSPKLFIHVFVGDRLAKLGKEKDTATKIVDIISILATSVFSVVTAYTIYTRTIDMAERLDVVAFNDVEMAIDTLSDSDDDEFADEDQLTLHSDLDGQYDGSRRNL